jgi:hypothetical protein
MSWGGSYGTFIIKLHLNSPRCKDLGCWVHARDFPRLFIFPQIGKDFSGFSRFPSGTSRDFCDLPGVLWFAGISCDFIGFHLISWDFCAVDFLGVTRRRIFEIFWNFSNYVWFQEFHRISW